MSELPEGQKPHLSPSAIDMLSKCGIQYEFRYVKGMKIPPAVAMVAGSATDKAVEADLTSKMVIGELEPEEKVRAIARDEVVKRWNDEGVNLNADERAEGEKAVMGRTIDKSVALSTLYHRQVAPVVEPIAVQRRYRLPIDDFAFDIVGVIDLQEPTTVRDLKTGGKSPSKDGAHNSEQLTMYGLAVKALDGAAPEKMALDTLVYTPKGKTSIVTLETTRTDADYLVQIQRVKQAGSVVVAGNFMPARPTDWWCSEKWCGYHSICPYVQKNPVSVPVKK